jgi:hypothetical protein
MMPMLSKIVRAAAWGAALAVVIACAGDLEREWTPLNTSQLSTVGFGGNYRVQLVSYQDMPFQRVQRQAYDFSCGSAAIASLLTYHYGRPTPEEAVYLAMWEAGDQEKIEREGFSMLDMRNYVVGRGLSMEGFRVTLEQVQNEGIPAITLINTNGYNHFVVIKGITDDQVLVGDPFVGTMVYDRADFDEVWNGVILAIRDEAEQARATFNTEEEWAQLPQEARPDIAAVRDSLAADATRIPFGLQIRRRWE